MFSSPVIVRSPRAASFWATPFRQTSFRLGLLVLIALFGLATTACGDLTIDSGGTTVPPIDSSTTTAPPQQDQQVNQLLSAYATWSTPIHQATDGRSLAPKEFNDGEEIVSCAVSGTREVGPVRFDDFAGFVFDGRILPGHVVRGDEVLTGDLSPVGLPRAPLTLQMNLASAKPTVEVANPTEAELTEAVAELKLDADARTAGIDVVPGDLVYDLQTTSSYEESLVQMGVSARYASRRRAMGFSSSFEQTGSKTKHSVTMRLLQPMYTISVDRSFIMGPGDVVAPSATGSQVQDLIDTGRIGQDAPPLLIDQVTYGRSVYVTVSSTGVADSTELRAAVDGAFGGFSGSASARHRSIMESDSTTITVRALGGDQQVALNALRRGEIQEFLRGVNVANATPLTFSLRTLDGSRVTIEDSVSIQDMDCVRRAVPTRTQWVFEVDTGPAEVKVYVNNKLIKTFSRYSSTDLPLTAHMREGRTNELEVRVWPDTCLANPNLKVRLTADGATKATRSQTSISCNWSSTFTINDADNRVTGPPNWTNP